MTLIIGIAGAIKAYSLAMGLYNKSVLIATGKTTALTTAKVAQAIATRFQIALEAKKIRQDQKQLALLGLTQKAEARGLILDKAQIKTTAVKLVATKKEIAAEGLEYGMSQLQIKQSQQRAAGILLEAGATATATGATWYATAATAA